MHSTTWLRVLIAAVAIDIATFVALDWWTLGPGDGELGHSILSIVELLCQLVIAGALLAVTRSMVRFQHERFHDQQVLAAAASTTPDWLWETDSEHRVTYSSPGVEHLLGYRPEELIGQATRDLVSPVENLEQLALGLSDVLTAQSRWDHVDVVWQHRAGHPVVLRGSASPIHDEAGKLVGYRGTRRLVTGDAQVAEVVAAARRRISAVIAANDVDVALQPIVSLSDGRLVGAEALARFRDGRGPDAWFTEARDSGRTLDLDRLTFRAALATMSQLPGSTYLSVNATPDLIRDPRFQSDVLDGCSALDRLVIEITEHERVYDYETLNDVLLPLRERGVRVAVDDAGAGFASLTHVLQLRPDIIKLDRELLTELHTDRARRSLVTALVLLAMDIGASVTGEGVETREQLTTLDLLAVDHAQGYLLGRPTIDPGEWDRWPLGSWRHLVTADISHAPRTTD